MIGNIYKSILALTRICLLTFLFCALLTSCKEYLDTKPDKQLSTPTSTEDLQLLLDDFGSMNERHIPFSELMSDNYYLTNESWTSLPANERNFYMWNKDATTEDYWSLTFRTIFQSNVVLDGLELLKNQPSSEVYNNIKGSALFFRGYYYLGLVQIYALPYKKETASSKLGLPLRLNSNINEPSKRVSLQQTYDRIITDLKEATNLLLNTSAIKSRPTKCAALGALAKTYLAIQEYDSAGKYADLTIKNYNGKLLDYNTDINPSASKPIPDWTNNPEVIIPLQTTGIGALLGVNAKIDTILFRSYNEFDIRKAAFYRINPDGSYRFKGNVFLSGSSLVENRSIMLAEMYLIRAEYYSRIGDTNNALKDLNFLLSKRWKNDQFQLLAASTPKEALTLILRERRKELVFTGTRWTDIRRLKDDPDFSIVPKRILNGAIYQLLPNSSRYALQFPQSVIDLSGMPQND